MVTTSMILVWSSYLFFLYLTVFWFLVFFEKGVKDKDGVLEKFPHVTVAVPAYNEEENVKETVDSILNLDYPKDKLELIVVNDGSKDRTEEIVRRIINNKKDFDIKLLSQENCGKGVAINKALSVAKGEFFATLDADSTIKEDALRKILPVFVDQEVAAVLPLMKVKNPKTILQRLQRCEYLVNLFFKKLMSNLDCVHVAPGPFSTYRKSVIKKLGGFDRHNLTEDFEITLRLQKYHYKIVQLLSTDVYTKPPKTFIQFYKQRNRWYKGTIFNILRHKNMLFNTKYGDFGLIQLPRVFLEGFIVVFAIFILFLKTAVEPLIDGFRELLSINFNIGSSIRNFTQTFSILDINITNFFYTAVTFAIIIFLLRCAYKYTREPVKKQDILAMVIYMIFYPLLISVLFLGVFWDIIVNKIQKW
ncbi:hypothetical protein CL621_01765 [archaeon]|nr:hypothetical protein [archaeon]